METETTDYEFAARFLNLTRRIRSQSLNAQLLELSELAPLNMETVSAAGTVAMQARLWQIRNSTWENQA